jgi:signal transduction histidine kinase
MPMGGTVQLLVEAEVAWTRIIVEDEGAGFSAEALAKLGEAFYSEKEGGMGLGLAVSQEICRAHGGSLQAMNREQGGARVVIELPREVEPDTQCKVLSSQTLAASSALNTEN